MTRERADEIISKVIFANFSILPPTICAPDAFHIGRMVGKMQLCLELELKKEIEHKVDEYGN